MANPVELAPDYYLSNFHALMDFVVGRYDSLLSDQERHFYRQFRGLTTDSQRLYVRLLSRKGVPSSAGALFRLHKLAYEEIGDLRAAADVLINTELLLRSPPLPLEELLPLYTKSELLALSPKPLPKTLKRPALEQALLELDTSELLPRLTDGDSVVALQAAQHFETFKLLFFGNLNQDLTDYVLRDLGLLRYEQYPLERQHLPFQTRAQLEQHLRYYECVREAESVLGGDGGEIVALAGRLPAGLDGDNTLQRRLDRLRLTLARQLERLEALDQADALYRQCTRPPARERRARIAVTRGDIAQGLALCREILADPHHEQEREFAERFGFRAAKKVGAQEGWVAPSRPIPPTETVTLPAAPQRVETLAAAYLTECAPGNQCFYVENTLINGMLGLYVWDILFAPLPGAFFNPFQIAPSDFRSADFYPQRRAAFEQRLAALSDETLKQTVWRHYRDKWGIANPLIVWESLPEALLTLALERIPVRHWQLLFRRLLRDITQHCSGLPDLILFPAAGGFELVEVKGPGDRLQQNQQRWLAFFAQHQIPHRVLHVAWAPQ